MATHTSRPETRLGCQRDTFNTPFDSISSNNNTKNNNNKYNRRLTKNISHNGKKHDEKIVGVLLLLEVYKGGVFGIIIINIIIIKVQSL